MNLLPPDRPSSEPTLAPEAGSPAADERPPASAQDPVFASIARLAASILHAPSAAVVLLDGDAGVIKGAWGVSEELASRVVQLPSPLPSPGDALLLTDARSEPNRADMGMSGWAEAALPSPEGAPLGVVRVLDPRPREWSADDARSLEELAEVAGREVEWRRREAEWHASMSEWEAALALRDRFYVETSHELRTPLSAILLHSELLLTGAYGPVTELQAEGIDRTLRSARHLLEVVNDVLDMARLQAGRMQLNLGPVALPEFLRGVLADIAPLAETHHCALELSTDGAPESVTSDSRRLRQILLNLLANAVKFGRGRPVRLEARTAPTGVWIEVRDAGPGIPEADIPRVFDEFVRLGPEDGSGLGLSISREFARALGGLLEVESTPGTGSTFRLFLPG